MRYELKKILSKRTNQIVLLLLIVLIFYSCSIALKGVEWVDAYGNWEHGGSAAEKLREAQKEWSGSLDQELLTEALMEVKEIYTSTEIDSQSQESNWILRHKLQGVQEIADLIGWSFSEKYSSLEQIVANLQPEELSEFYNNRINERKDWLYSESSWGYYNYSEQEKQYILQQYAAMDNPLEVGYHEGWVQANEHIVTLLKCGIILLSFILAGVFSDEFTLKTDSVFYNTQNGRTKATAVKVGLGFLIITLAYWICTGAYSLITLGSLGMDGAATAIQSDPNYWHIRFNLTFRQKYLLTLFAGYIGYLFIGFLVMWISARTKSSVLAILIPSLIILLPEFLGQNRSSTMIKIMGVLPDRLLDMGGTISSLNLYSLGSYTFTPVPVVFAIYPCITILLLLLCYREYRHKQIA